MLNPKILSVLVTALLISIATSSQAQNPIIGSWKVDVNQSISLMPDSLRSQIENLDEEIRQRRMSSLFEKKFIFNADGSFTAVWKVAGTERVSNGSWTVSAGHLTLNADGRSVDYNVTSGGDGNLVMEVENQGGYLSKLYLVKNTQDH